MPSKSRRHVKKHSFPSKKKKGGRSPQSMVARRQAAPQLPEPTAPAEAAPAASMSVPVSAPAAVYHGYTLTELKRIGILAGIMLVILVILALVLP